MLLTLLLVAQVRCEWVEISQQHFSKPVRPMHNHPLLSTVDKVTEDYIEETTIINGIYTNHTLSEYSWNKSQRTPNTGNINRVRFVGGNVQTNPMPNVIKTNKFNNYGPPKEKERSKEEGNLGTAKKVPNIGSIKRVQLENSPVKSPSIQTKTIIETNYASKVEVPNVNEKYEKEIHHNHQNIHAFSRNTEIVPFFTTEISKYDNTAAGDTPLYSLINVPQEKGFEKQGNSNDVFKKLPDKIMTSPNIEMINILKTENSDSDENVYDENFPEVSRHGPRRPIIKLSEPGTKNNLIREHEKENVKSDDSTVSSNKNQTDVINTSKLKPDNKVNTIENVIKLMKIVADTISRHTRRSFNSKMTYLQELRDTILVNIENRIDATWPDDDIDANMGARSRSRPARATPRGHVEFPSSEGALMSISFLTFAVFLIKLVLQVIHTYKNKAMMVAPLVVAAAGRTADKA